MKRVVSVSLGSSKRDKTAEVTLLGERFSISRIGVNGDLGLFSRTFSELDGEVDALGIGGADLYLWIGNRKYEFRQIRKLVSGAKRTPVVDGSGLKNTLEPKLIRHLCSSGVVDFENSKCLLTMAVDRFGMAKALDEVCPHMVYGDIMFGLGLPIRVRRYRTIAFLGSLLLPVITKLPFKWFYPTGEKQSIRKVRFPKVFEEADVVCGDWHYIRRHAPDEMNGKVIITNTLRKNDLELLRSWGVKTAIASTPEVEGESFGTNVMEAVLVASLGRSPDSLTARDYEDALQKFGWQPTIFEL